MIRVRAQEQNLRRLHADSDPKHWILVHIKDEHLRDLMCPLAQQAQNEGLDHMLNIHGPLALGVQVLDARKITDRLNRPLGPDTRARWHLRGGGGVR